MPVVAVLLIIVIALLPAASLVGLGFWAWWLRRQGGAPSWAVTIAYGLVALGALAFLGGAAWGASAVMGIQAGEPQEKARMLAEGISATMNCGALGLMIAVIGMLWLGFFTWRCRKRAVEGAGEG